MDDSASPQYLCTQLKIRTRSLPRQGQSMDSVIKRLFNWPSYIPAVSTIQYSIELKQ
jgi:hypothetical protein